MPYFILDFPPLVTIRPANIVISDN